MQGEQEKCNYGIMHQSTSSSLTSEQNPFKFVMATCRPKFPPKPKAKNTGLESRCETHACGYSQSCACSFSYTSWPSTTSYPHRSVLHNTYGSCIAEGHHEDQNTDDDINELSDLELDPENIPDHKTIQAKENHTEKSEQNQEISNESHNEAGHLKSNNNPDTKSSENGTDLHKTKPNSTKSGSSICVKNEKFGDQPCVMPIETKKLCKPTDANEEIAEHRVETHNDDQELILSNLISNLQVRGHQQKEIKSKTRLSTRKNSGEKISNQTYAIDTKRKDLLKLKKKIHSRHQRNTTLSDRKLETEQKAKCPCACTTRRKSPLRTTHNPNLSKLTCTCNPAKRLNENTGNNNKDVSRNKMNQTPNLNNFKMDKKEVIRPELCISDDESSSSLSALVAALLHSSDDESSETSPIDSSESLSDYHNALEYLNKPIDIENRRNLKSDPGSKQRHQKRSQTKTTTERTQLQNPTHRIFYDILQDCQKFFQKIVTQK